MIAASTREKFLARLWDFQLPEKAFPYYRAAGDATEATLMALLAFFAAGSPAAKTGPALSRILRLQNADGSLGASERNRADGIWLTAPLAIVLHHYGCARQRDSALNFLRALKSDTTAAPVGDPKVQIDQSIAGWPWVRKSFGWVEPTAWALIAFNICGQGANPRAEEGRRLLLDRQIASGGWNYGNKAVYGTQLIPFWDTTSLALLALHGYALPAPVSSSLQLLEKGMPAIESLYGMAWAAICLECYKKNTATLQERLASAMEQLADEELNVAHYALGVIALSGRTVFSG